MPLHRKQLHPASHHHLDHRGAVPRVRAEADHPEAVAEVAVGGVGRMKIDQVGCPHCL